jgi:hypothetical protein
MIPLKILSVLAIVCLIEIVIIILGIVNRWSPVFVVTGFLLFGVLIRVFIEAFIKVKCNRDNLEIKLGNGS